LQQTTGEMCVVQEKIGTKIWVPAPQRLLDYMRTVSSECDYILASPRGEPGSRQRASLTHVAR
jgi:hypothetical protein